MTDRVAFAAIGLLLLFGVAALGGCGSGDDGDPGVGPSVNLAPQVSEISIPGFVDRWVVGDVIGISISASDADGDSLTYAWDFDGDAGGVIADPQAASTTIEVGSTAGGYLVRCTVSDGEKSQTKTRSFHVGILRQGTITQNTTWTKQDEPYVILRDLRVDGGVTLTIEPGTVVQFRRRSSAGNILLAALEIDGALVANGTMSEGRIVFEPNETTGSPAALWQGIEVRGSLDMEHCRIERAEFGVTNSGAGGVVDIMDVDFERCDWGYLGVGGSSATLTDVSIANSGAVGVQLSRSAVVLTGVEIEDSGGDGILLKDDSNTGSAITASGCRIANNEGTNVVVEARSGGSITCSNLLPAPGGAMNLDVTAGGIGVLDLTNNFWGVSVADPGVNDVNLLAAVYLTIDGCASVDNCQRNLDLQGVQNRVLDLSAPCP